MSLLYLDRFEVGEIGQIDPINYNFYDISPYQSSLRPIDLVQKWITIEAPHEGTKCLTLKHTRHFNNNISGPVVRFPTINSTNIQRVVSYGFNFSVARYANNTGIVQLYASRDLTTGLSTGQGIKIADYGDTSGPDLNLWLDENLQLVLVNAHTNDEVIRTDASTTGLNRFDYIEVVIDYRTSEDNIQLFINNRLIDTGSSAVTKVGLSLGYVGHLNNPDPTYDSKSDIFLFYDNIYISDNTGVEHTNRLGPINAIRLKLASTISGQFNPVNAVSNAQAVNKGVINNASYNSSPNSNEAVEDLFKVDVNNLSDVLPVHATQVLSMYRTKPNIDRDTTLLIKNNTITKREPLTPNPNEFIPGPVQILEKDLNKDEWTLDSLKEVEFGYRLNAKYIPPSADLQVGLMGVVMLQQDKLPPRPLKLRVETNNISTTPNHTIKVGLTSIDGGEPTQITKLKIDFGDGIIKDYNQGSGTEISHIYANETSTHIIKIWAEEPITGLAIQDSSLNQHSSVTAIIDWGELNVPQIALSGCYELTSVPNYLPNTITTLNSMFDSMRNFNDGNVTNWDTSNVTDMSRVFFGASKFNQPLNWNTTNVTNMRGMFAYASEFNSPINFINTSSVTDMQDMFNMAIKFNQPVEFNTSSVTNMYYMFYGAKAFNHPVEFDTSNVTNMQGMFGETDQFNQPVEFDTSEVTTMRSMFYYALQFNQPVTFDLTNVNTMQGMFGGANKFNQPVTFTNTSNVQDINNLFYAAVAFNQQFEFDTSSVHNMYGLFYGAKAFNKELTFVTDNVTNMQHMFYDAINFNSPLNFSSTLNVTSMRNMFNGATKFNQAVAFDTDNVTDMAYMFNKASAFNQDLSRWCVTKIKTKPSNFDTSTTAWVKADRQPVWGTCPGPEILRTIEYVASGDVISSDATKTLVVAPPDGITDVQNIHGAALYCTVIHRSDIISVPTNWVLIANRLHGESSLQQISVYRKAGLELSDLSTSYTWMQNTSTLFCAQMNLFTCTNPDYWVWEVEIESSVANASTIDIPIVTGVDTGEVALITGSFNDAVSGVDSIDFIPDTTNRVTPISTTTNRMIVGYQYLNKGVSVNGSIQTTHIPPSGTNNALALTIRLKGEIPPARDFDVSQLNVVTLQAAPEQSNVDVSQLNVVTLQAAPEQSNVDVSQLNVVVLIKDYTNE